MVTETGGRAEKPLGVADVGSLLDRLSCISLWETKVICAVSCQTSGPEAQERDLGQRQQSGNQPKMAAEAMEAMAFQSEGVGVRWLGPESEKGNKDGGVGDIRCVRSELMGAHQSGNKEPVGVSASSIRI